MTFTALLHLYARSLAKCFDVSLCVNNLNLYSSHIFSHCQSNISVYLLVYHIALKDATTEIIFWTPTTKRLYGHSQLVTGNLNCTKK